jgi:ATP/maltotriose-dependent transcriptional regulator MalT
MQRQSTNFGALESAREALHSCAWETAFSEFSRADREAPLGADDLSYYAMAAHLTARASECSEILTRAHQAFLHIGEQPRAIRCAFWLSFMLMLRGEMAQAGGWLARARRLLDECGQECVEEGYLQVPAGYRAVQESDFDTAFAAFGKAVAIGERFHDADIVSLARQGQGRVLIRKGEVASGLSLLDEAMVAVTAGDVSPMMAGGIYCSVIEACSEIFDVRRAQEWTAALDQWCTSQPELVPYHGQCQIRRSEILKMHGAWEAASQAAEHALERLSRPRPQPGMGPAVYCCAELHRLRGEFAQAEAAYKQAAELGQTQQPGIALLHLAQGKLNAACASIRNLEQQVKTQARSRVLDAYVEIMLASGDVHSGRAASDELGTIASRVNTTFLRALASRSNGAVLLVEAKSAEALPVLRQSLELWRELDAPYDAARVRVLIGKACHDQGDEEQAAIELEAARRGFEQLGALPDLSALDRSDQKTSASDSPLTSREREVLALIATGKTNRAIANKLNISEKTVARHISNIFNKLDLSSRSAATAYAYQHHLV